MAPVTPTSWYIYLCVIPSFWVWMGLWVDSSAQNRAEVMGCQSEIRLYRRGFHLGYIPLDHSTHSWESQLLCCDAALWRSTWVNLEVDSLSQSCLEMTAVLADTLIAASWGTLNQEHLLGHSWIPDCKITTVCCFQLLSSGVLCYAAVDN